MIVTFYSYKGGVGRSMALANVADLLARSGLRVLIVDFDLEAPGLEHFFPIDHEEVRGHEGLLDLLLAFKYSMSVAASGNERDAFRRLERFVTTVYPTRDGAGGLDLIPAGRRLTDEEIGRYGEELRRFDWLDFYFSWSGEVFFEWLRQTFRDRYDAVLVDSRTGVTEMGGVCAYQLADAIVVLCAPNLQNVEGTDAMVRHFLSAQVRAVRGDRPIDVLVVPARVDQWDSTLRQTFEARFRERFAVYLPDALADAGLGLWDLQIPYESRYAFDERVVTNPRRQEERRGVAAAYARLLEGIALLAPDGSSLAGLRPAPTADGEPARQPIETRYDPTRRFAAPDVYISFGLGSEQTAAEIQALLERDRLTVVTSADPQAPDAAFTRAAAELAQAARVGCVLVGPEGDRSAWLRWELEQLLESSRPVVTVLLPDADPELIPPLLRRLAFLDFRTGIAWEQLMAAIRSALAQAYQTSRASRAPERSPYPGMVPFREEDHDVFLGREAEVDAALERLGHDSACTVIGPAGIGKTSLVFAGLVPALRRGALTGSDQWPVVSLRPGERPLFTLFQALLSLGPGQVAIDLADEADLHEYREAVERLLRGRFERVVVVVDQLEELFTQTDALMRKRFVESLVELWRADGAIAPVLLLRADFLAEASALAGWREWILSNPLLLGPLSGEDLRAAIEVPARRLGLAFEPGLVERLMADVADEPGTLPLLQEVLLQLWEQQREGYLTHKSYEYMGEVSRALATRADAAIAALSDADRDIAQKVLLRLVAPGDGGFDRRRSVDLDDLSSGIGGRSGDSAAARRVVDRLIEQRLLVATAREGRVDVELVHEALIVEWPTLREWIEGQRVPLQARARLDAAARDWVAADRDEAALLRPERLRQLTEHMGGLPLSDVERSFVEACERQAEISRSRARGRLQVYVGVAVALTSGLLAFVATGLEGNRLVAALGLVFAVVGLIGPLVARRSG